MPAAVQAAVSEEMQIADAFWKPSLTTVEAMLAVVTQVGVRSTDWTAALAVLSLVVSSFQRS